MKFTLSWLKEYLDTTAPLEDITRTLTMIGLEVESVSDKAAELKDFIVAEILEAKPHPDADRLRVCQVNNGKETLTIVCGAPNARAGIKVVLASVGVIIPNGQFAIKKSKIRGQDSNGMLCSATELNLGTDGEGIIELPATAKPGEPIVKLLGLDDPVIEINLTPNRGDALGVYGIARDLAAAGIGSLKPEGVTNEEFQKVLDTGSFASSVNVSITTKGCSYFIGRSFKGVKNGESPDWLKKRLESIGQKPISALVDITNYLTHAFARPAHVYDAGKLKGDIVVRDAKQGEKLTALDGKEYTLDAGMVVIADNSGTIGLGGIIGGESTGCDANTTDVFLEIALFDAQTIARTGQKLQINSDARYRFERFVSPATVKHFITATKLIQEICGGEASKPVVAGSIPMERRTLTFRPARVKELVGIDVPEAQMRSILEKLGFIIEGGATWKLGIPSFRPDIEGEADICEEIARIHGYDTIPATPLPASPRTAPALTASQRRLGEMRRILAARGLKETVGFSFIQNSHAKIFTGGTALPVLANPISADLDTMRPSILPGLLVAAAKNAARGKADVALFETGPLFIGAEPGEQRLSIAAIRTGNIAPANPFGTSRTADAFDAKADALAALSPYIRAENVKVTREAPAYYHPGRSGALKLGQAVLGYFGEMHPQAMQALGLEGSAAAFEIFPQNAPAPKPKTSFAKGRLELSNFQAVVRDFAFVVDASTPAEDILAVVRKAEKTLIESVSIFDIYAGKGIEDGKKSVAFSVRLQPKDKTLTDAEIEAVCAKIVKEVGATTGGTLRS